ncbi:MAG: hypothetical protein KI791_10800 [Cyclobacteriaceae bacterium]|nr:hypothetical protein [Cyclobacteriaceae bacterium SS2]
MKINFKNQYLSLSAVALILLASSCNMEKRRELQAKADQLEQELHARDSAFNEIMDLMTRVESQIEKIKERENLIANRSGEDFTNESSQGLVEDIDIINELIESTNAQVKSLSSKLNKANIEIGSFKMRVNKLSQELDERKNAIATLEEKLTIKDNKIMELDGEVKSLVTRVNLMDETIQAQKVVIDESDRTLHKAFYIVNTEKHLLDEGLITKEGGFLGLGKTTELEENVSEEKFEVIDIRQTSRFYVNSNKMSFVTEHPKGSYEVVKDENEVVQYIDVTNPGEFWKISKYLVISVKG